MNRILAVILFLGIAGQSSSQAFLLVESTRRFKNYKYFPGDKIMVSTYSKQLTVSGLISGFSDSTILIGEWDEVRIDDISQVHRVRGGIRYFSNALLLAGPAYLGIDLTNRLINNDSPVVLPETALISGGLVATGLALKLLRYRKLDCKDWNLMIIDPSGY